MRDLYPPPAREIAVEVELLLQLQRLVASVGLPASLPLWRKEMFCFDIFSLDVSTYIMIAWVWARVPALQSVSGSVYMKLYQSVEL